MQTMAEKNQSNFTAPGMQEQEAFEVIEVLSGRLASLIDLQLTLKHLHWNVVGPNFIGVHEMLDPQVDAVRAMSDTIAERIATLGGIPVGTTAAVAERRPAPEYALDRAPVSTHLSALDIAYGEVNAAHRHAIDLVSGWDAVTEDMLIAQLADLEQFQWFVRAHLESNTGQIPTPAEVSAMVAAVARTA